MNLPAGNLSLCCPGIKCRWLNSQLFNKVFDRQKHRETSRESLTTPPSPHDAPAWPWHGIRNEISVGASWRERAVARPSGYHPPWGPFRFRPVPCERAIPPSSSTPPPRAGEG